MNDQPVTPSEMALEENLGRTTIFEEIKAGRLHVYWVGRKALISPRARAEWRRSRELESARKRAHSTAELLRKLELQATVPAERKRLADDLEEARSRAGLAAKWLLQLEADDTVSVPAHERASRSAEGAEVAEAPA